MAHGRSLSWAIPVHAILSVEQTKKAPQKCVLFTKAAGTVHGFLNNKSPSSGEVRYPTHVAVWLGVCCVGRVSSTLLSISSREAGAAKRVPKKKHRIFSFAESNSYLVYRPEHGRTTRRT